MFPSVPESPQQSCSSLEAAFLHPSNTARARAAPPSLGPELGAAGVQDREERQQERVVVTAKGGCAGPRCWDRAAVSGAVVGHVSPACSEVSEGTA